MTSLRYALRSLSRSPGFVTIAIVALALGLGLATTMFGVMDAVVNPYSPYRDPDAVYDVSWRLPRYTTLAPSEIERAIRDQRVFEDVVPVSFEKAALEAPGVSRQVAVAFVTNAYFDVVGIRPMLGRAFKPTERGPVAVVSVDIWRRLYAANRDLTGATVTLDGTVYTIVGVLPQGATHPVGASVWVPLEAGYELRRGYFLVGRIRAGVRYATVAAALHELSTQLTDRYGERTTIRGRAVATPVFISLRPLRQRSEQLRDINYAMVAAAVLVLLIACANLGHLMSARGLAKRRELAVRMAVGAGRGTIVLQMFAECLLITAAGAALGALVAVWGGDIIANRMPIDVAWIGLVQPHLSWRVFAIGATCAGVAAFTFGLVPAVGIALDINLDEPLKDGAGTTGRHRQRYSPLVVFEVALALVVIMAGGLLLRTVRTLSRERFGFETRNLLLGSVAVPRCSMDSTLPMCRYFAARAPNRPSTTYPQVRREELLAAMADLAAVEDAAFFGIRAPARGLITAEMSGRDSNRTFWTRTYTIVSPTYLRTMRLPIRSGRDFEPGDVQGHGVAVIDPVAADLLYPRQDPVGRMLKLGAPESDAPWIRIIGVARNPGALMRGDEPLEPTLWVSAPLPSTDLQLVARAGEDAGARAAIAIQRALLAVPGVRGVRLEPYGQRRAAILASRRFLADVFVTMGAVSLALAALGLYGVLAYAVTQRMREFAVRVAVGAQARQVVKLIVHDTLVMLLAGIGIGAIVALVATKYVDKLISGVYHTDALTLVVGELLLLGAGLVAALGPARRAARANPLDIMRAV